MSISLWEKIPIVMHPLLQPFRNIRQFQGWDRCEREFITFLKRRDYHPAHISSAKSDVLVLVNPWPAYALLPWFNIALALGMQLSGKSVRIVWDDTVFGPEDPVQQHLQSNIRRVLEQLHEEIEYKRLSEFPTDKENIVSKDELRHMAELNTVQHFHTEEMSHKAEGYCAAVEQTLKNTAAYIHALFQQCRPDYIVMHGGIYRSTGLFLQVARKMGIRVATVDGGSNVLLVSTDGIAAYLDDIPRAFRMLPVENGWVVSEAQAELKLRMQGRDAFSSQAIASAGYGHVDPFGVLLTLCQSFDTSALGRHLIYKNQTEWMLETVAWVLEHTSETIVVRRHPGERVKGMESHDDYEKSLFNRFGRHSRLRYIASDAPVNTYDLISQARVVVPHVSTVGLEAIALGKPVVAQSSSYYTDLGIVWLATTPNEYFDLLAQALRGQLVVNEQKRELAWRCYYLTQVCNFYPTRFTPSNFSQWVQTNPRELFSSREVSDVLYAIDSNTPLSLIRHRNIKHQCEFNRGPKQ